MVTLRGPLLGGGSTEARSWEGYLYGIQFRPVTSDRRFVNGNGALKVVRMVEYVSRGSWTNDIDTIAQEEQLVVKRVKEDSEGMDLPQEQVLKCSYPAAYTCPEANKLSPRRTTAFCPVQPWTRCTVTPYAKCMGNCWRKMV